MDYFKEGRLAFPKATTSQETVAKVDGSYHSCFGPCVASNGVMYGNSNHNVSLAATRITKTRLPGLPGFEQLLQENQRVFIEAHDEQLSTLRVNYDKHFTEYTDVITEALEHHEDPHLKKALRVLAWKDILDFNLLEDDMWYLPGKGTLYKMKIFEIAKPGKTPRMIGDLGVHASLQGFRITKFLKHAMAVEPFSYRGGEIEFCPKPAPAALESVFRKLIDPPGKFYFVYFSDDACLSIKTPTGILRFNLDISSCDASHTASLFKALRTLTPERVRKDIDHLVNQCSTPITIYDLIDRKKKVTLKPNSPRLYSGSTLTTAINNLANILIALSIAESDCLSAEDVIRAAAKAGYIVTCLDCSDWHKLQFLKHSPVIDTDGQLRALLNIGVLLRLSGTCKGDLPGKKTIPLRQRAEAFQASLLRGAYPKANFTLIDNLRKSVGVPTPETEKVVASMFEYKVEDSEEAPVFRVHSEEVFKRYDFTELETAEVELDFGNCKYGEHYTSNGTSKILEVDYNLSGREYPY